MKDNIDQLLQRSAILEANLVCFLGAGAFVTNRLLSSRIMCGLAFEHAESIKLLTARGNFSSAVGLLRSQYEASVRAIWLIHGASDDSVSTLMGELTQESVKQADKVPLADFLKEMEGKAPDDALRMLHEFKRYSWKPLSSLVHGGMHALHRHGKGYPLPLLIQLIKASNGVSVMVGMHLIMISGDPAHAGKIPQICKDFADCLPDPRPPDIGHDG
jgi:hypothetical protein